MSFSRHVRTFQCFLQKLIKSTPQIACDKATESISPFQGVGGRKMGDFSFSGGGNGRKISHAFADERACRDVSFF